VACRFATELRPPKEANSSGKGGGQGSCAQQESASKDTAEGTQGGNGRQQPPGIRQGPSVLSHELQKE